MSDIPAIRRQLKIKSGAVQRLFKETSMYRKEIEQLEAKRSKLVQEGAEEWDVKNAVKMSEESKKLVKDTTTRLDKAADELHTLIASAKEINALADDEELAKAEKILNEAAA